MDSVQLDFGRVDISGCLLALTVDQIIRFESQQEDVCAACCDLDVELRGCVDELSSLLAGARLDIHVADGVDSD